MVVGSDRAQRIEDEDRAQSPRLRLVSDDVLAEQAGLLARRFGELPERLREAAGRIVERISWHRRQPMGRGVVCVELCPAYFLTTGEIAETTARRAWDVVRGWIGWSELSRRAAEALGVRPRELAPGQVHGRFLALDEAAVELARGIASRAGIERAGGLLSDEEHAVSRPSPSRTVRCPWHEDRRPSLWLSPSGTARCFGCGACGRWSPGGEGRVLVRRWLTEAPSAVSGSSGSSEKTGIYAGGGTSRAREGRERGAGPAGVTLRADVGSGEGRLAPIAAKDPLDAIRRADRVAEREAGALPSAYGIGGGSPPDRLVRLERYTPGAWSRAGRGYRPSSWRSDGLTRFVLLDFDGAEDGPVDSLGAPSGWGPELGGAVELAVCRALPGEVTGRIAVVRTGPSGLQVLVELADAWRACAWAPGGWLREAWAELVAAVGPVVRELFPGAEADARATGPGRCARLPGVRRTKARDGGKLWTARLAYATELREDGP